jgi:hypothetical protein
MMEEVLRDAFIKTDEEFSGSGLQSNLVGSTAVVALVGTHRVWIANCGEFGGVCRLWRGGAWQHVTRELLARPGRQARSWLPAAC